MAKSKARRTYADLVRSFDHAHLAALPEYVRAVKALDELVHAINRAKASPDNVDDWVEVVRDMAVSLPFHDRCNGSPARRQMGDHGCGALAPPVAFRVEDGWVTAAYACTCGRRWTCGWSASGPDHY